MMAHSMGHTFNDILFLVQLHPCTISLSLSLHVTLFTYICMVLIFHHTCPSVMHITLGLPYMQPTEAHASQTRRQASQPPRYTWLAYLLDEHAMLGCIDSL